MSNQSRLGCTSRCCLPRISNPFPWSIYFILGTEFCERFSFYGMNTILAPYLTHSLGFSENQGTIIMSGFTFFAYFISLFGGILSDSWLGRFKTIMYLSVVYCIGSTVLSITAIPGVTGIPPAAWGLFLGLVLVACGTGGIKPCVSTMGGDQFDEDEISKKASFFSAFYFMINAGSLISMFLTPLLKEKVSCFGEKTCYPLAFGVPAILMFMAVVFFFIGKRWYVIKKPEGNMFVKQCHIIRYAVLARFGRATRRTRAKAAALQPDKDGNGNGYIFDGGDAAEPWILGEDYTGWRKLQEPPCESKLAAGDLVTEDASSDRDFSSLKEASRPSGPAQEGATRPPSFLDAARDHFPNAAVNDLYDLLQVLKFLWPIIFFWALYHQQASRWVYQGYQMDPMVSLFGTKVKILPEQMQLVNAVLILVFIPIFNKGIFPLVSLCGIKVTPFRKVIGGMLLTVGVFVWVALLQYWINETSTLLSDAANPSSKVCIANCVSILWQLPQYVFITAGEILVSITMLSFSYEEAPLSLKSVVSALSLLTVAAGNLLIVLITAVNPFRNVGENETVANYGLYSCLCFVATLFLIHISKNYQYRCRKYA